jgi:hypothetical protein
MIGGGASDVPSPACGGGTGRGLCRKLGASGAPPQPSPASGRGRALSKRLGSGYDFFPSTSRTGVSGVTPPRLRANVSAPFASHSPFTARRAKVSQSSAQSPSE